MKNAYVYLIIICFSLVHPGIVRGQHLPMLASRDALRSYALQEVFQAWGSVWSRSIVNSPETGFHFKISDRPADIRRFHAKVASQDFDFRVANPRDEVFVNLTYADREGYPLFQGASVARFVRDPHREGRWNFPERLGAELFLAGQIPLNVSNVYWARILVQDEQGRTVHEEPLTIDERTGRVLFPAQFAGVNGHLILNINDPRGGQSERIINLRNGLAEGPVAARTVVRDIAIHDVVEAVLSPANMKLAVEVKSFDGYGESPTLHLRVEGSEDLPPGAAVATSFYAVTTEGELPKAIGIRVVRPDGAIIWNWFPLAQDGNSTELPLLPGLYHAIFAWPNLRPYPPYIPGRDGGKG